MGRKVSKANTKTDEIKIVEKVSLEMNEEENKKTSQLKKMSGETEEVSTSGTTRFRVDLKKGLSDEQVQTRIEEGLVNNIGKGSTKTIPHIIFSNIFIMFSLLVFLFIFFNIGSEICWIGMSKYFAIL